MLDGEDVLDGEGVLEGEGVLDGEGVLEGMLKEGVGCWTERGEGVYRFSTSYCHRSSRSLCLHFCEATFLQGLVGQGRGGELEGQTKV